MTDDRCPHGMLGPQTCVECMAEGPVAPPALDTSGQPERADSRIMTGRYDKDCPVCHFTMLETPIVHTTRDRWAHAACVDPR